MCNVIHVDKCGCCGAYTVHFDNDSNNSMRPKDYRKHFKYRKVDNHVYGCNYCVNKWGIDLCGCGSGNKVGRCDESHRECRTNTPAQVLFTEKTYQLWAR